MQRKIKDELRLLLGVEISEDIPDGALAVYLTDCIGSYQRLHDASVAAVEEARRACATCGLTKADRAEKVWSPCFECAACASCLFVQHNDWLKVRAHWTLNNEAAWRLKTLGLCPKCAPECHHHRITPECPLCPKPVFDAQLVRCAGEGTIPTKIMDATKTPPVETTVFPPCDGCPDCVEEVPA